LPCARRLAHGKNGLHRQLLCRALFAVRSARQSLCRVLWAFCRVPEAHGKAPESGSAILVKFWKMATAMEEVEKNGSFSHVSETKVCYIM